MITVFWDGVQERPGLTLVVERAVKAAMEHLGRGGEVNVDISVDERVHELNLQYRGVNSTTDVLSFAAEEGGFVAAPPGAMLGDIIISFPKAQAQAQEYGHSLERELAFLTTHGMLHLMGFDHAEPAGEKEMIKMQKAILAKLGVPR